MFGILENIKEYFLESREHAVDDFWKHENLIRVNLRAHLDSFLGNKGKTPIFFREQENMQPPSPWEALSNVFQQY